MSTDVAKREAQVPDLVRTPALEITADDIALPRLYVGQFMTKAVQDQLVKPGCIFSATSQDDGDPVVLYDPSKKDARGVRFYVLTLRKGKSWSPGPGEDLQLFDYDDPNAPADSWVTYNYMVFVPEADEIVPFKLLLTKTGTPAARNINTILKKNAITGPSWINAFELKTAQRENAKGKYFIPVIKQVEADPDAVDKAGDLYVAMSASPVEHATTGEEPAI